jgi:hypothetical protein
MGCPLPPTPRTGMQQISDLHLQYSSELSLHTRYRNRIPILLRVYIGIVLHCHYPYNVPDNLREKY